jgi:hypothetical protein
MTLSFSNPLGQSVRTAVGALGVGALAAAFFLSLLWRDPLFCWNDDYMLAILPVFADMARAWSEGNWPLLSPYCWACGNLAGEYQFGTFSVFVNAAVVLVWKFDPSYPAAATALSAIHICVMAAGAFLLGRRRGLDAPLAMLVAMVGTLNSWMVCWAATNWFGALAGMAWLPWAWWALEGSLDEDAPAWRRLLPAPFIYLLIAAGFPYTVLMLGVVTLWLALRHWTVKRRVVALWPLAAGWALGLGLSAPAWLSLLEYMAGSARAQGEGMRHDAWRLPFGALPGMVMPSWKSTWTDFIGAPFQHAAVELTGAAVPLLAIIAFFVLGRNRAAASRDFWWDLGLAAAVLVLSMAPSAGVFRWSFRWLPFFHLAFALAGAQAWQFLSARNQTSLIVGRWELPISGLIWFLLIWNTATTAYGKVVRMGGVPLFFWLLVALGGSALEANSACRRWLPTTAAIATMMIIYLYLPINPGLPRYTFTQNLANPAPLSLDRLYLSIHLPPHQHYHGLMAPLGFGTVLRMGNTAMYSGVRLINGYSPIKAAGVGRRLSIETHGEIWSARVPELLDAASAGADGLLWRLGVDGLLIDRNFPVPDGTPLASEWERAFESSEGIVYHRRGGPLADVRAWESREPGGPKAFAPALVRVRENVRQRVAVEVSPMPGSSASGPILLAFRRPHFPGYRAFLNGQRLPVGSYQGLLPTVELPAGSAGRVTLEYRSRAAVWGGAVALASLLTLTAAGVWRQGRR